MNTGRRYSSPLRAEQAAQTRDRIIEALVDLLQDGDHAAIGMQDVADRAGVSVRTVYRAFPTRDDLFDGVLATIKERFEAVTGPYPMTAEGFIESAPDAVRAVYELEPLYRALFATPSGRESHLRGAVERRAEMDKTFAAAFKGVSPHRVRLFTAIVYSLCSSNSVLFLKDYAGLDADDVGEAIQWAVGAMADAMQKERSR